ncbi:hypothetical protein M9Y10_009597 [Tritrichomonas musculus]|uniref:Initiator binding domain-containing protein n=1 Tax=Tritrichomonas musculus TaxID=1915356 RepID=A0ABR2INY6_9EUKA
MSESEKKKIRFKFSFPTVPHETQTTLMPIEKKKESTVENMRVSDVKTLLLNEVRPITTFSKSMSQWYNTQLGFYYTAISDPRFEPLTPPKDLYSDIQPGIICNLKEDCYVLSNQHGKKSTSLKYETDLKCLSFMECLETGVISHETLKLLIQNEYNLKNWDNGKIICKVIDDRIQPQKISYVKLEIGPDAIELRNFKTNSTEAKLEFERRTLLYRRPMICTDPSPDVARVQSVVDTRKKMWLSDKPKEKERQIQKQQNIKTKRISAKNDTSLNPSQRPKEGTISRFTQLRTKADIPDSLQQKIASITLQ